MAMRQGQMENQSAKAAPAAVGRGNRRRSSIGRHRPSFAAEAIPEETAMPAQTPAPAAAAQTAAEHAAADLTEDMAISPDRTPGLLHKNQQQIMQQEQETPVGDGGGAAAQDADGLTTNLLLDDRSVGGWDHVIGAGVPGTTGRGSVGSNVLTMHGLVSETLSLHCQSTECSELACRLVAAPGQTIVCISAQTAKARVKGAVPAV